MQVFHDGDTFPLQCGSGMQRVSWIGRVAAQRLGSGGAWCPPDKEVGRPKEFIPGRIFAHPSNEELDSEATIASLLEGEDGERPQVLQLPPLRIAAAHSQSHPCLTANIQERSTPNPRAQTPATAYSRVPTL